MKVAVAHRSATVAELLSNLVRQRGHEAVWTACDTVEAIRKCRALPPDLVLLDVHLAVADHAEPTRQIIAEAACKVIIVTPSQQGQVGGVYEAMEAGALDSIFVPDRVSKLPQNVEAAVHAKLDMVGKLLRGKLSSTTQARVDLRPSATAPIVAMGASTGGPQALAQVLAGLPRAFPVSLLIVQHIGVEFVDGLAEQLAERSAVPVRGAKNGEKPTPGVALLAATTRHLVMTADRTLAYREEPRAVLHRPSVDVLFESLASHWPDPGVAVLLTGMGKDGAAGMTRLRLGEWRTIAQDAATSVVDGMPRAAREAGAAEIVLPLHLIASKIADFVASRKAPR